MQPGMHFKVKHAEMRRCIWREATRTCILLMECIIA